MFVHGWTCNHTHFAPQIEHFATDHRVVAVDLRGHGGSDAPEQRYTVSAPEQVNAMIERFLAVALH